MSDQLDLIMHPDGTGKLRLWACRGSGKGCKRNLFRTSRKPCDDCAGPLDEKLTLAEVQDKLAKGDA